MNLDDEKARILADLRSSPPPARHRSRNGPHPLNVLDRRNSPDPYLDALAVGEAVNGHPLYLFIRALRWWFRGRGR